MKGSPYENDGSRDGNCGPEIIIRSRVCAFQFSHLSPLPVKEAEDVCPAGGVVFGSYDNCAARHIDTEPKPVAGAAIRGVQHC